MVTSNKDRLHARGNLTREEKEAWENLIHSCKLVDMMTQGKECPTIFTWSNRQRQPHWRGARLDRCYLTNNGLWVNLSIQTEVRRDTRISNHMPLLIKLSITRVGDRSRNIPLFKLNTSHIGKQDYDIGIKEIWAQRPEGEGQSHPKSHHFQQTIWKS